MNNDEPAADTFAWGESVTRDHDRILVPLNTGGTYTADLVLDPAGAQVLADMLHDAAGPEPCPYGDGSCPLDARKHYHLARPGRADLVVYYGDDEDLRAFPPNGRLGR